MKLKRKIFLSNALMVWLSLSALLAIGCLSMGLMRGHMVQDMTSTAKLDSRVLKVYAHLTAAQEQDSWDGLEQALKNLGYHLHVTRDGGTVISNLGQQEERFLSHLPAESWPTEEFSIYHTMGMTVVAGQVQFEGAVYQVTAVRPSTRLSHGTAGFDGFERFLLSFLLFGCAVAGVILIVSQLFTRSLVRRIMEPIDKLTSSAERIEEGDLSTPISYTGEEEFVTVCNAFNEMQQHLLKEQEKNATYEKARTDMISGISHDLRTPLTSVKGYIKGIQDGVANTPEKQGTYLAIAYRKACDMDRLLERLFYFSKLETGNLPFFPVQTDLGEFTQRFVQEIAGELVERKVQICYERPSGPHPVSVDPEQLWRVLSNLVENALKYAHVPELCLTLSVHRKEGQEHLIFADNGQGVPQEKLPHIFEQFYRADESRSTQNSDGNGLGLYIVKHILCAHGGQVAAHNAGGLHFTLTLPSLKQGGDLYVQHPHR